MVAHGGGVALLAVAATVAVTYFLTQSNKAVLETDRVAVMVFENQTGDPSLGPVGRMAADWIPINLSG